MTFCVAVGAPDFGLVACDAYGIGNLDRLPGGWVTMCGSVAVTREMVRLIEGIPAAQVQDIAPIIHACGAEYSARTPNDSQVTMATVFVVYRDGGFHAAGFTADGLAQYRTDVLANWPLGIPEAWAHERFETFRRWLHDGQRGPWDTIRQLAEMCADASERAAISSSVRGELEVGLTLGERELYLSHTLAAEIRAVSDEQLTQLFREVTADVALEVGTHQGFQPKEPIVLVLNVTAAGVVTATVYSKAAGGMKSVRIKALAGAEPTDAQVLAESVQATSADGTFRSGTLITLTPGQTATVKVFGYEGFGVGTRHGPAVASVTHYEGQTAASVVESSNTDYEYTFRLQATDADGEQVKLHYRVVEVSSPLDDYTSGAITSDADFHNQPWGKSVTVDRGLTDRFIEVWASDINGNKSAITRDRITALTASAKSAAINTVSNSTAFVGSCPNSDMVDTVTWSKGTGVPAAWTGDTLSCFGSTSCTPNVVNETGVQSPRSYAINPGTQVGLTNGPELRRWGVRLRNSYGELVEEQYAPSGLSTTYDFC